MQKARSSGDANLIAAFALVGPSLVDVDKAPDVSPHNVLQQATQTFLAAQRKVDKAFDRAAQLRLQAEDAEKESVRLLACNLAQHYISLRRAIHLSHPAD